MTTVVVPATAPRPGAVYDPLVETTPLTAAAATDLYAATFSDACRAVAQSGGDLLVNYRPDESGDSDPETALRAVLADAVDVDADATRFEVQVGSTPSARLGNTLTHLLEEEDVGSVAVLYPDAPLQLRTQVDSVAMALRRSSVVLSPGSVGTVAMAGFTAPIDFTDAFAAPALPTLVDRALDAGHEIDFARGSPRIRTVTDLASVILEVQARERADRIVPPHTAAVIETLGLGVDLDGDTPRLSMR